MGDLDRVDPGRVERRGDRVLLQGYWWRTACMPSRRVTSLM